MMGTMWAGLWMLVMGLVMPMVLWVGPMVPGYHGH